LAKFVDPERCSKQMFEAHCEEKSLPLDIGLETRNGSVIYDNGWSHDDVPVWWWMNSSSYAANTDATIVDGTIVWKIKKRVRKGEQFFYTYGHPDPEWPEEKRPIDVAMSGSYPGKRVRKSVEAEKPEAEKPLTNEEKGVVAGILWPGHPVPWRDLGRGNTEGELAAGMYALPEPAELENF
jgi:hypothetical protein